jgi:hypothetical protein
MTTMTRRAAVEYRRAAPDSRSPAEGPRGTHRPDRSSQVSAPRWALLACGAVAVFGLAQPTLLPWLLVPAVPALLLWEASDAVPRSRRRRVMGVFSVAALAAVAAQLAMSRPWVVAAVTTLGATVLFLVAAERVATAE